MERKIIKAVSLLENDTSSLSQKSSKTKPGTKLVLVSREPLLQLEFTKPNEQMFIRLIIYLKNSTFHSLKIIVDTLIDVRNESSKHDFLKSVKINTLPCFLTQMFQSVSGHSSEQSIDHNCSQHARS